MAEKQITIARRPSTPDAWVENGTPQAPAPREAERTVRLSVDLPRSLHKQLKNYVNEHDTTIQELVEQLIRTRLQGNP
jgi:hypothetical protein